AAARKRSRRPGVTRSVQPAQDTTSVSTAANATRNAARDADPPGPVESITTPTPATAHVAISPGATPRTTRPSGLRRRLVRALMPGKKGSVFVVGSRGRAGGVRGRRGVQGDCTIPHAAHRAHHV